MAFRTNAQDVKEILDTALEEGDLHQFISTANLIVDDLLDDKGFSTDRLEKIELWLSAHLASMRDQEAGQRVEREHGDARSVYGGQFGQALKMTRYGQHAILLDTSGTLASIGTNRAAFRVYGPKTAEDVTC